MKDFELLTKQEMFEINGGKLAKFLLIKEAIQVAYDTGCGIVDGFKKSCKKCK